jgi:protein-S-isoprenylcysteine O-methyltransferase Ste14
VPPVVYFFLAVAGELLLNRYAPLAALIPYPWCLLGIPFIAAGVLLIVVGLAEFARRRTTLHTDRPPSTLITGSVFAFSRNPGYLALVAVLAGEALWLGNLSPWLAPLIMAPVLNYCFIPSEEATLAEVFGARYAEYRRRVRRWL